MLPDTIEFEQDAKTLVVSVGQAELPHTDMQEVIVTCQERMRYDGVQDFIFDLSGVQFLASACIGLLVELLQEVEHVRGKIALANCADNVAFLFRVTRLDSVFTLCEDLDEAKAAI